MGRDYCCCRHGELYGWLYEDGSMSWATDESEAAWARAGVRVEVPIALPEPTKAERECEREKREEALDRETRLEIRERVKLFSGSLPDAERCEAETVYWPDEEQVHVRCELQRGHDPELGRPSRIKPLAHPVAVLAVRVRSANQRGGADG